MLEEIVSHEDSAALAQLIDRSLAQTLADIQSRLQTCETLATPDRRARAPAEQHEDDLPAVSHLDDDEAEHRRLFAQPAAPAISDDDDEFF